MREIERHKDIMDMKNKLDKTGIFTEEESLRIAVEKSSEKHKETNEIPNVLPDRLVGKNYVVKTTSVKVIENIWDEFKKISSEEDHSSIELLSLALLEFIEKYRSKQKHCNSLNWTKYDF